MYVESYVGILAIEIRKNDQETIASLGNKWLGFLVDSDGNGDKEKMIEWGSTWTNTLWWWVKEEARNRRVKCDFKIIGFGNQYCAFCEWDWKQWRKGSSKWRKGREFISLSSRHLSAEI